MSGTSSRIPAVRRSSFNATLGEPGADGISSSSEAAPVTEVRHRSASDDLLNPTMEAPLDSEAYATRLRRRLVFFFMNPYEKWKARRQLPYKLLLQVAKIVLVTLQLTLFGSLRTDHINYLQQSRTALRHIFLDNWESTSDVLVYPPATGPFSVYTQDAFLHSVFYAISQYYSLDKIALSKFYTDEEACFPLSICRDSLMNATDPATPQTKMKECFGRLNHTWPQLSKGLQYFKFVLNFTLSTVHVPPNRIADAVSCYRLKPSVLWEDVEQSGQMEITLTVDAVELLAAQCAGQLSPSNVPWLTFIQVLDFGVLLICFGSFVLCARALVKGYVLRKKAEAYFAGVQGTPLSSEERWRFLNVWYCMIILNDSCICLGTMLKMGIDFSHFNESVFTGTTILLGVGTLLVWCGVLRYLGFFAHYNVLMQTMKRSAPNVLRFTVCAALLYAGFLLCGWIVLGPYSIKFKDVLSASECLFSLINGDDMFATFYTISDHNQAVKWFARIYLYLFVSIFIYVVLSLFISIILSAYDVVKEQYNLDPDPEPSEMAAFMAECVETPRPAHFRDAGDSLWGALKGLCGRCRARHGARTQYQEIGVGLSDAEDD